MFSNIRPIRQSMTEKSFWREDGRLLTGRRRCAADWNLWRQLHGCVLRAPRPPRAAAKQ
jgi:hypothetical protein